MRKKLTLLALAGAAFLWASSSASAFYQRCNLVCSTSATTMPCTCPNSLKSTTCAGYLAGVCWD